MRKKVFSLAIRVHDLFHKIDKMLHRSARRLFKDEYSEKKSFGELEVLPRVFEYSFAVKNLQEKRKVLEVGCTASSNVLPVLLAQLGCEVYGVDLRPFNVKCSNFTFVICDARYLPFRSTFECCYSISTIEHVGLPGAWNSTSDLEGDSKAIKEMSNVIKPRGSLIIMVPFGKSDMLPDSRIYDTKDVQKLFSGLNIVEEEYIIETDRVWLEASREEASKANHKTGRRAVGMFKLTRQGRGRREPIFG